MDKYRTAILQQDSTQGQTIKDEVEAFVSLTTAGDAIMHGQFLFKLGDAHQFRLYPWGLIERVQGVNFKHLPGAEVGQSVYIVFTLISEECISS